MTRTLLGNTYDVWSNRRAKLKWRPNGHHRLVPLNIQSPGRMPRGRFHRQTLDDETVLYPRKEDNGRDTLCYLFTEAV